MRSGRGGFWRGVLRLLAAVAVLMFVAAAVAYPRIRASIVRLENLTIDQVDLSRVRDGEYEGEFDGVLVKARVRVSVSGGRITDLTILKHENGLGRKAESIVQSVVQAQSLSVDTVSGATHSSKVLLKATEVALRQGAAD